MRIAVSGTYFIGKSTLIEDFLAKHPNYRCEKESYYKLQDEKAMELSLRSLKTVTDVLSLYKVPAGAMTAHHLHVKPRKNNQFIKTFLSKT